MAVPRMGVAGRGKAQLRLGHRCTGIEVSRGHLCPLTLSGGMSTLACALALFLAAYIPFATVGSGASITQDGIEFT